MGVAGLGDVDGGAKDLVAGKEVVVAVEEEEEEEAAVGGFGVS